MSEKPLNMWPSVKTRLKSNSEITSIKVWLQALISLWFQFLTWPYSVNFKDTKTIFTECSLQHLGWFLAENSKSQKMTLAGFSQRGSHIIIFIYEKWLAPQSEQTRHNKCCHCVRRWMPAVWDHCRVRQLYRNTLRTDFPQAFQNDHNNS